MFEDRQIQQFVFLECMFVIQTFDICLLWSNGIQTMTAIGEFNTQINFAM